MATRTLNNISNLPQANMEGKRVTRASRKVLGEIQHATMDQAGRKQQAEKENILVSNGKPNGRLTKFAARRMIVTNPVTVSAGPMEIEPSPPALPPGVKDIDAEDGDNPQLCSEYARDTFVYLRQLERRGAVRPDCLAGCPTNDKMRAVLVDWLVEVQIQFKLLQETLFTTVDTIDR